MESESALLVARWREGDDVAASQIFHRYCSRLETLIAARLDKRLASRVAAEDIVQSVFRSFFARTREGQFSVQQPGDLWRLLFSMAMKRTMRQVEYHTASKRALDREQRWLAGDVEAMSHDPGPEEAAALTEIVEQLFAKLEPLPRQVAQLRLEGNTLEEISSQIGRSQRTVRRLLANIREVLVVSFDEERIA